MNVVDAATCAPIANAAVDVWHADAEGVYSGFGAAASRNTFLRGIQMTDANGTSQFATIYPGWYRGRAVHIHVKVHRGGSVVHTGQLFFDETVTEAVYATSPYNARRGTWLRNRQDSIYADGGAQSLLALTPDGNDLFSPAPLGHDLHYTFGNNFAIPIVAQSPDKVEQRSATLSFVRGTSKVGKVDDTVQPPELSPLIGRK